jgi:hypothetical protein
MKIIVRYEHNGPKSIFKSFEKIINHDKVVYLDCSDNKIYSLPKSFSKLTSLQVFRCPGNNIKFLPDELSNLTSLQILHCSNNDLESLPDLSGLTSLQTLNCSVNNLKFLPDLSRLTSLKNFDCSYNKLEVLPDLSALTSLERFHFSYNSLRVIPDILRLTSLQILNCSYNKIEFLPDLSGLNSLQYFYFSSNNIKILPLSLLQCRNLRYISCSDNQIENTLPVLTRFFSRLKDTTGKDLKVYSDTQSVHNAAIQDCIRKSILNILEKERGSKSLDQILNEILSDEILTKETKESLFEYCRNSEIHSTLNISFSDFLIPVWTRIQSHKESLEMKKIMNIEMTDALCKCFTGRLSRLLNVLNGYYEDIKIEISENDQIANIIYLTREFLSDKYDLEAHKELVRREMSERKYNSETIDIWVDAIE